MTFSEAERVAQSKLDVGLYRAWGWNVIDRNGGRGWITHDLILDTGTPEKVEEKFRFNADWGDVLVEIWEGVPNGHPGWLRYCEADSLHYVLCSAMPECEPYKVIRLNWPEFRLWFADWLVDAGRGQNVNSDWIVSGKGSQGCTINISVPLDAIPGDLKAIRFQP